MEKRMSIILVVLAALLLLASGCNRGGDVTPPPAQNGNAGEQTPGEEEPEYDLEITLRIDSPVMTINQRSVQMDVAPLIKEERTLVPIRFIIEAFQSSAYWMPETQQVRIVDGDRQILLSLNSTEVVVGAERFAMAVPPEIIDGRTFVPLRFVSEQLGAEVEWEGALRQITIVR